MTLAAQDFSREIDLLIRAGVVVLFLVIPIVRGVMEARRKQAERERQERGARQTLEPKREAAGQGAGKDLWEKLLRGEALEEPPWPPVAAPADPTRPAKPARAAPKQPKPAARPLPRPAPVPAPPRAAPVVPRSLEAPSRELAQAAAAQWNAPEGLERARAAAVGAAQPAGLGREASLGSIEAPLAIAGERRRAEDVARAREWRRAVVAAELLSVPLALRPVPAWPGAPPAG